MPTDATAPLTLRDGCCADWPKPCSYHEGYLDGYDVRDQEVQPEIKQLRAALDTVEQELFMLWGKVDHPHGRHVYGNAAADAILKSKDRVRFVIAEALRGDR